MNHLLKFTSLAVIAATLTFNSALGQAAADPAKAPTKKATTATSDTVDATATKTKKAKKEGYKFWGEVSAVDKTAITVSLKKEEGARIIHLDSKSELARLGKPAILGEIKPGDYAHGRLYKNKAGEEVIMAAKFDLERSNKKAIEKGKKAEKKGKSADDKAAK
ncbi:MAG: hypothetical protein EXS36_18490 [Pedosphaera sp.]|nr:hypothetical protein [Pedosphaera sp.]